MKINKYFAPGYRPIMGARYSGASVFFRYAKLLCHVDGDGALDAAVEGDESLGAIDAGDVLNLVVE